MSTQGLVTLTDSRGVYAKIVAGCDGMNAVNLASALALGPPEDDPFCAPLEHLYAVALANHFGCRNCLVVIGRDGCAGEYEESDLDPLYRATFDQPRFNPRWDCGEVAHFIEVAATSEVETGSPSTPGEPCPIPGQNPLQKLGQQEE